MRVVRGSVPLGLAVLGAMGVVPVALSGGLDGARAGAACGEQGWPGTAQRAPAAFARGAAGYFVWHDGSGWHLRARAGAVARASLSANARIVVNGTGPSTGATLGAGARRLTFRVGAGGAPGSVDFTARCATRLSFAFPTGSTPSTPARGAPTPIGGTSSTQPVFLGAQGRAPAGAFALDRPGSTGLEGRILLGAPCPVAGVSGCASPKPMQGTVQISTRPTSRSRGPATVVATVSSDASGAFSANLAPGAYTLLVLGHDSGFPTAKPTPAGVQAGVVTLTDLVLESGVR